MIYNVKGSVSTISAYLEEYLDNFYEKKILILIVSLTIILEAVLVLKHKVLVMQVFNPLSCIRPNSI